MGSFKLFIFLNNFLISCMFQTCLLHHFPWFPFLFLFHIIRNKLHRIFLTCLKFYFDNLILNSVWCSIVLCQGSQKCCCNYGLLSKLLLTSRVLSSCCSAFYAWLMFSWFFLHFRVLFVTFDLVMEIPECFVSYYVHLLDPPGTCQHVLVCTLFAIMYSWPKITVWMVCC